MYTNILHYQYILNASVTTGELSVIACAIILLTSGNATGMPKKTKLLTIRIDAELKRTAKKVAVEDGRSLSNWVTRLIEKEVKRSEQQ